MTRGRLTKNHERARIDWAWGVAWLLTGLVWIATGWLMQFILACEDPSVICEVQSTVLDTLATVMFYFPGGITTLYGAWLIGEGRTKGGSYE